MRTRYWRLSECGGVWIAECAAERIGNRTHFKPLQKSFGLRVINEGLIAVLQENADSGVWQHCDGIAGFKIALAGLGGRRLVRELPNRHRVVGEGIVESFGSFMRERGNVLKSGAKQTWRDPTGESEDPTRLGSLAGIENIAVEAEHAAVGEIALVVDGKQKSIG